MRRALGAAAWWALLLTGCVSGPQRLSGGELEAKGTASYAAPFQDVYDAAYVALEQSGYRVTRSERIEGHLETERASFGSNASRAYRVEVFQRENEVAVVAVPQLFSDEGDISGDAVWVLGGVDGEERRWEQLHERIRTLLDAWRSMPDFKVDPAHGTIEVGSYRTLVPADWVGIAVAPDRHQVMLQKVQRAAKGCSGCAGGMNPTLVLEIAHRGAPELHTNLVRVALEGALGPGVVEPEAWLIENTPYGRKGVGVTLADAKQPREVTWHEHDFGHAAWLIRAVAACASVGPAACEVAFATVVDGIALKP